MADQGKRKSRDADKSDKNVKKGRYSKKDRCNSQDRSKHKCSQTERTSVQHVAVQWENHATSDEDTTDTRTSDQSVQSRKNNSGISDNQIANGSSLNMVDNKGPIQLGGGSTVINNPTYNITNNHYYPPHPDYPNGNHIAWTSHPQASLGPGTHHPGLPPPPAAQYLPVPHHTGPTDIHQAISQYPHSNHNEHTSMTTDMQARRRPVESTMSRDKATKTVSTLHCDDQIPSTSSTSSDTNRRENVGGGTSSNEVEAQTRPVPDDVIQDTVRIIDSRGQVLEPGDAVQIGNTIFDAKFVVYIGGQRIVRCVGRRPNLMVKEETLTKPFYKRTVYSDGQCALYPRGQRVERAKEMIGSRFTDPDWANEWNFLYWVYTGLGRNQAHGKGFWLYC